MNEKKKSLIVFGLIVLLIVAIPVLGYVANKKSAEIYEEFDEKFNSANVELIYIGRPTCSNCVLLTPLLEKITKEHKITYTYVNIDKLTDKHLKLLMAAYEGFSEGIDTPTLLVTENGKVLDALVGYGGGSTLFNFLKDDSFIDPDAVYDNPDKEESHLKMVSLYEYLDVLKTDETIVLNIGRVGCTACQYAKPILNQVAEEKNVVVNYLNTDITTTNVEKYTLFNESLSFIKDGEFESTPTLLIIKNGEVLDSMVGAGSYDDYVEFFQTNNIIE